MQDKIDLLTQAIRDHKQVVGLCNNLPREFCPHILGTRDGLWRVLSWQFAGQSEKGLPPEGGWRCLELRDMEGLSLREGPWYRGFSTGQREQSCVIQITASVDSDYAAEIRPHFQMHTPKHLIRRPPKMRW